MTRISNLFSHIEKQPQGNVTRLIYENLLNPLRVEFGYTVYHIEMDGKMCRSFETTTRFNIQRL